MTTANTVYRDFNTDGDPSTGLHMPVLSEIRGLLTGYEAGFAAGWPKITDPAFGSAAAAASAATNSTAINAALAYCAGAGIRMLWVPPGTFGCNDDIVNTAGVYFVGPGTIIVGSSGKPISFNETDFGKTVAGMHNLLSWHATISGSPSVGNIALVGDSNTQGGGWLILPASYPEKILTEYGRQKGFSPYVYNYGVGGTGINDLDLTAAWVTNPQFRLVIIGYGTNDAGGGIAAYAAALRAKLNTLRAARPADLGILLKSPITGTDTFAPNGTPHLRDERFMRQVHDVHVQMVQEFNCAAVDTFSAYWYMRGSYGGAHMDTLSDYDPVLYRPDAHIHARDNLNTKIWADIMGPVVFPDSSGIYGLNNRTVYYNNLDVDFVPLFANAPTAFKQGKSVFPVATAQGWPAAGDGYNDRGQFGTKQEIWASGVGYVRYGLATFPNTAAQWFVQGAIETTAGLTIASPFATAAGANALRLTQDGRFTSVQGYITQASATIANGASLFTVPVGQRPKSQQSITCFTSTGEVHQGRVNPATGVVTLIGAAAACTSVEFSGGWIVDQ